MNKFDVLVRDMSAQLTKEYGQVSLSMLLDLRDQYIFKLESELEKALLAKDLITIVQLQQTRKNLLELVTNITNELIYSANQDYYQQ